MSVLINSYVLGSGGGGQSDGWDGTHYWIEGVQTTLPESGDGFWASIDGAPNYNESGGTYYILGVATNLDSSGTGNYGGVEYSTGMPVQGWFNGSYYINGVVSSPPDGWHSEVSAYYIDGSIASGLDMNGFGEYNNMYYSGYPTLATGWYNGSYYIEGVITSPYDGWHNEVSAYYISGMSTSLDQNGSGEYNNKYYSSYPTLVNGWFNGSYYIEGVITSPYDGWHNEVGYYYIGGDQTSLDSNGDGTWNGDTYVGGVIQ